MLEPRHRKDRKHRGFVFDTLVTSILTIFDVRGPLKSRFCFPGSITSFISTRQFRQTEKWKSTMQNSVIIVSRMRSQLYLRNMFTWAAARGTASCFLFQDFQILIFSNLLILCHICSQRNGARSHALQLILVYLSLCILIANEWFRNLPTTWLINRSSWSRETKSTFEDIFSLTVRDLLILPR